MSLVATPRVSFSFTEALWRRRLAIVYAANFHGKIDQNHA
jgi:hypothetical protein